MHWHIYVSIIEGWASAIQGSEVEGFHCNTVCTILSIQYTCKLKSCKLIIISFYQYARTITDTALTMFVGVHACGLFMYALG